MAELVFDLVEQILVRLDVKDLIRCKSVCKSWQSFISTCRFVKAHLNHTYNNGVRRILRPEIISEDRLYYWNIWHIVGSSNGLVCISPKDSQLLVTNPSTRELKNLQTPPYQPTNEFSPIRSVLSWGFGYDSSTDDYKVIVGFRIGKDRTRFYLLTLKSNIWKLIGEVNYRYFGSRSGILCDGALHWFMIDRNNKKVIISLHLSREEFKETPQPDHDHLLYEGNEHHRLGVIEECLCIYNYRSPSSKKWVMKNSNVKQSWELYDCEMKCDAVHYLRTTPGDYISHKTSFSHDGIHIHLPRIEDYIRAHIFVQSLVSPNVNNNNNNNGRKRRQTKNNKRSVKGGSNYVVISRSFLFSHSILKRKRKRQEKNSKRNAKGPNTVSCKRKKKT